MTAGHDFENLKIAVLLPCYNEEMTIGEVVEGFRKALPGATVYVYDNNSSDMTSVRARVAGAVVVREPRQGKGNVVRRMFSDTDADVYIMADGDGTYNPQDGPLMVATLLAEQSDMVVGTRNGVVEDAGRTGHAFGNRLFNAFYKRLFGRDFTDIFSGYRAFSRRFVKTFPAISSGFEIETEMSVHASQLRMPVTEIGLEYGRRPQGSTSKLSTFGDGLKILLMFSMLLKETKPFVFFSAFAGLIAFAAIGFMLPVLSEYFATGFVTKMPSWLLAVSLGIVSMLTFLCGIILDSVTRGRAEAKRLFYLNFDPVNEQRNVVGIAPASAKGKKQSTGKAAA